MIPVGIKLKADGSEFLSGVDNIMGGLKTKIAAAFTMSSLVSNFRGAVAFADTIGDVAEATGLSTKAVQELGYAFTEAGASTEDMIMVMRNLSQLRERAIDGDKKAAETLGKLGLGYKDIRALGPEEMFNRAADGLARMPDPMEKAALAAEAFGKQAGKLLQILGDLNSLRSTAGGFLMTDAEIKQLSQYNNLMNQARQIGEIGRAKAVTWWSRLVTDDALTERGPAWDVLGITKVLGLGTAAGRATNAGGEQTSAVSAEQRKTYREMMDRLAAEETAANYIDYIDQQTDWLKAGAKSTGAGAAMAGQGLTPVGLTSLQQIGAMVPGAAQQNQVVPLLQKQATTLEQVLRELRAITPTVGGFRI